MRHYYSAVRDGKRTKTCGHKHRTPFAACECMSKQAFRKRHRPDWKWGVKEFTSMGSTWIARASVVR